MTQPTLPVTLASFLMNTSFRTRYQLCLNLATRTSVNFAVSDHISITKLPVPLPHPSCRPSLTTASHFITTYQILNQTVFSISRILLHVLSSGPQSLPISTLLSNLYINLKLSSAQTIKFFLLHTKSSPPLNLRIYIILSLFSPIVALVHRIS